MEWNLAGNSINSSCDEAGKFPQSKRGTPVEAVEMGSDGRLPINYNCGIKIADTEL